MLLLLVYHRVSVLFADFSSFFMHQELQHGETRLSVQGHRRNMSRGVCREKCLIPR